MTWKGIGALIVLSVLDSQFALGQEGFDLAHELEVYRHIRVKFSNTDAEKVLARATDLLRAKGNDCCVNLMQGSSGVGTFGATDDLDHYVQSTSQMKRVWGAKPGVKVVEAIVGVKICRGFSSVLGCTLLDSIVVKRGVSANVWAHEFGHKQRLGDCRGWTRALMYWQAAEEISPRECEYFRQNGKSLGRKCELVVQTSSPIPCP